MKRTLTEEQILKKLNVPDFRHVSKDKIIEFASMLPEMEPEVALKALEQFPEFASSVIQIVKEYKSLAEEGLKDDSESLKSCYEFYSRRMSVLENMLQQEDLSFEDQLYILNEMKEITERIDEKDSERRKMLMGFLGGCGVVTLSVIACLSSNLGGAGSFGNVRNVGNVVNKLKR